MTIIIGIPVIILLVILQSTIVSRINLSFGSADIVLLVLIALGLQVETKLTLLWFAIAGLLLSIISSVPLMYPLIPYIIIAYVIIFVRKRIWKIPMLMMIIFSFLGTIICLSFAFVTINLTSASLPLDSSIVNVLLPSTALNIAIGVPVYLLVKDWSKWLNPRDEE